MPELVIKSKIKKIVKLRISKDLPQALDKKVEELLKKAEERAKANHRPQDL